MNVINQYGTRDYHLNGDNYSYCYYHYYYYYFFSFIITIINSLLSELLFTTIIIIGTILTTNILRTSARRGALKHNRPYRRARTG